MEKITGYAKTFGSGTNPSTLINYSIIDDVARRSHDTVAWSS
jgi:hypothetical protein